MARRLLILGGTTEAADLARRVVAEDAGRIEVVTSLAGRLKPSRTIPGEVRIGGFGGVPGMIEYLTGERIDLVIDATHPFAAIISRNAEQACRDAGVPRLMLLRPPWRAGPDDRWTRVADVREASRRLPQLARRAFLTTGSGSIDAFAGVVGVWFLVRLFELPATVLPLAAHEIVIGRPPFTFAGEIALMRRHRIDTLVSKQSGGPTDAKLAAARAIGARVVMVERPSPPAGEIVETVDAALAWIARRL